MTRRKSLLKVKPAVEPFKASAEDNGLVKRYFEGDQKRRNAPKVSLVSHDGKITSVRMVPAVGEHVEDRTAGTVAAARFHVGLGVASLDAANMLFSQLVNSGSKKTAVTEAAMNACLALVAGIAPRDETEAMLAAQMVATHNLVMELHRRVMNGVETIPQLETNGGLLVRLQRTYTAQVEALARYRNHGQQTVRVVHQHVQVAANNAQVNLAADSMGGEGEFTPQSMAGSNNVRTGKNV